MTIYLRAMLDAVNPDDGLRMVNPVENAMVADAEFAKTGEVVGQTNESPVHHRRSVFREPDNLPFDTRADGRIEPGELRVSPEPYFDAVGHGT